MFSLACAINTIFSRFITWVCERVLSITCYFAVVYAYVSVVVIVVIL